MRSTILVAACFLTLPAAGQIPHYRFTGNDTPDEFGTPCRGAGDVDADGFDDLIVGAHYEAGP